MDDAEKSLAEAIIASDARQGRTTTPEKALEDARKVMANLAKEGYVFKKIEAS